MCFYTQQLANIAELRNRFKMQIEKEDDLIIDNFVNAFAYPNLPIITNDNPQIISTSFTWGLMPTWSKDLDFRKNTLIGRVETIDEKISFKNINENRCLIIATAFYEWRWLDEKGKVKEKYQINSQVEEIFCFAGLYNIGVNPITGDEMKTYTLLTTEANDVMKYVHNYKQRMPIIINKKDEKSWLDSKTTINDFAFPYSANIIAFPSI